MRSVRLIALIVAVTAALAWGVRAARAEERRSSISGIVYFDANGNGRPDPEERVVRNLQLDLDGPNLHASQKSGENGAYAFNNLGPGEYRLTVVLPSGYALSQGANAVLRLDGTSAIDRFDIGVIRLDPTPTPTPTSTPTPLARIALSPPTSPTLLESAPEPQTAEPPVAAGGATSNSVARGAPPPPPAPPAPPTLTATPTPTREPTATPTPTPTRTPPPVDEQQAAAERARAALAAPDAPRTGSARRETGVLLDVPFRSALDGSDYAHTNSGSAALGMALEAYGVRVATSELRALANLLGRSYDVSQPPRIEVLVRIAEQAGLRGLGLYQGLRLALWTVDDVRNRVQSGYPVLTQVLTDETAGDGEQATAHYVLIVGTQNGAFIYHDPTFSDQRGAWRSMPEEALVRGWSASPGSGQAVAFALGPDELGLLAPPDRLYAALHPTAATPTPRALAAETAPDGSVVAPGRSLAPNTGSVPLQPAAEVPMGGLPLHPLMLAFWATVGVLLVRVILGLIFG